MRGTIEKLPSGSYWVTVFLGRDAAGKWIRSRRTVEGTKKDADCELTKMLRDVDTGGYVDSSKETVAVYLERWLTDYVAVKVEKPSTRRSYAMIARKHLIPNLGRLKLAKLTPTAV